MMRIGYPCNNLTLGISAARTFRLATYSPERLLNTIDANLDALDAYLAWNAEHDIRYFRISSGTVPFASHPVMDVPWQRLRGDRLARIGETLRTNGVRVNVHPGQYTLINSPRAEVVTAAVAELMYHADLLDGMGLDDTNKVQIHVGGVYGDKPAAIDRFVERWERLPARVKARLVIENDERHFDLADALEIHRRIGIPVLFDSFHHSLKNHGESLAEALDLSTATWRGHGPAMLDYSSQDTTKRPGAHTTSIDLDDFAHFLSAVADRDVDVMLEIKDKERSALRAIEFMRGHPSDA
jgi:UV DNA damage endonuclease